MLCCTPLILQEKHLPVGCTSSLLGLCCSCSYLFFHFYHGHSQQVWLNIAFRSLDLTHWKDRAGSRSRGWCKISTSIGMCCVKNPWNRNINVDRNLKTLWMEVNHTHLQSSSPNTQHLSFMIQPLVHPCSLPAWTPLLHLASLPSSMCSDWLPMSLFQMSAAFRHFCSQLS